MKLWQKKSNTSDLQALTESFTVGNDYQLDQKLIPYDVQASIAHIEGLESINILSTQEVQKLKQSFENILKCWEKGEFEIHKSHEDGHTAIEHFLIQECGEIGKKVHTGRSRNDQVLVAMRLWERENLDAIILLNKKCVQSFLNFAKKHEQVPMPGFTHTQVAMPMNVGMWAGALAEMMLLNFEELKGFRKIINQSPLGSAAGFGVSFDLPREAIAKKLGFEGCLQIALTSQNTRGKIEADLLAHLSSLSGTLAHFANDLVWWSSSKFKYFDVHPDLTTGSSIMPQKKNLDPAELVRGSHALMLGYETMLKNLNQNLISGYHRDLQLSKEPTMKGVEQIKSSLEMSIALIENIEPNQAKMEADFSPDIFAADKANQLVKEGKSFREAYLEVKENLESLKDEDIGQNLKSKTHLGASGNLGLDKLEQRLKKI